MHLKRGKKERKKRQTYKQANRNDKLACMQTHTEKSIVFRSVSNFEYLNLMFSAQYVHCVFKQTNARGVFVLTGGTWAIISCSSSSCSCCFSSEFSASSSWICTWRHVVSWCCHAHILNPLQHLEWHNTGSKSVVNFQLLNILQSNNINTYYWYYY